jgi:hypothetical protein
MARAICVCTLIPLSRYFPDQIDFPEHMPPWMLRTIKRQSETVNSIRFTRVTHSQRITIASDLTFLEHAFRAILVHLYLAVLFGVAPW